MHHTNLSLWRFLLTHYYESVKKKSRIIDELVKSLKSFSFVIPAEAGIQ